MDDPSTYYTPLRMSRPWTPGAAAGGGPQKALLIACGGSAMQNGQECNLFGLSQTIANEADAQAACTEAATFSNLTLAIFAGGDGTNTLQFRDAGANGNQVVSFAGAQTQEDTVNSDTLSAGDLFNLAYTDTGTSPTLYWMKGNVAFASGHGNFHGVFGAMIFDVDSSTRFIGLAGAASDGKASEAHAGWKTRAYDSFEAFQVNVSANARSGDSTFTNRINSGNGSGSITFATTETGLKQDTGLSDAITDGQIVDVAITLGSDTGPAGDLTVALVLGTFKSSSGKSESFACGLQANGLARAASATADYCPIGGYFSGLTAFTETQSRIKPGFAATVGNLRCYLSANTYGVDATLKLYQNGVAVITTTLTAGGGAAWYENTSDTVTIDEDDELSLEFDEGTSGSATIQLVGLTFSPL